MALIRHSASVAPGSLRLYYWHANPSRVRIPLKLVPQARPPSSTHGFGPRNVVVGAHGRTTCTEEFLNRVVSTQVDLPTPDSQALLIWEKNRHIMWAASSASCIDDRCTASKQVRSRTQSSETGATAAIRCFTRGGPRKVFSPSLELTEMISTILSHHLPIRSSLTVVPVSTTTPSLCIHGETPRGDWQPQYIPQRLQENPCDKKPPSILHTSAHPSHILVKLSRRGLNSHRMDLEFGWLACG